MSQIEAPSTRSPFVLEIDEAGIVRLYDVAVAQIKLGAQRSGWQWKLLGEPTCPATREYYKWNKKRVSRRKVRIGWTREEALYVLHLVLGVPATKPE